MDISKVTKDKTYWVVVDGNFVSPVIITDIVDGLVSFTNVDLGMRFSTGIPYFDNWQFFETKEEAERNKKPMDINYILNNKITQPLYYAYLDTDKNIIKEMFTLQSYSYTTMLDFQNQTDYIFEQFVSYANEVGDVIEEHIDYLEDFEYFYTKKELDEWIQKQNWNTSESN